MKRRVVFDTNVLISAVLSPNGKPFQCTALAKKEIITSVTSREILEEFKEKLIYKLRFESERVDKIIDEILAYSELIILTNIPKIIIDKAIIFYKKFSEAKTFRGLNRDGIIAASIYISFRENKYPRTIKEISSIFHIDNTSTTRGCKIATSLLNVIEDELPNEDKTNLFNTSPSSFIYRYCSYYYTHRNRI